MAPFEAEIVTNHFVETASTNRQSRKVTRYHDRRMQETLRAMRQSRIGPTGFPAAGSALE